jgi:hypothetical protein
MKEATLLCSEHTDMITYTNDDMYDCNDARCFNFCY